MMPSGSGSAYYHENTFLLEPTKLIDFGWYALFSDVRVADDWEVFAFHGPDFITFKSIQNTFISNYLSDPNMKKLRSLSDPISIFSKNVVTDSFMKDYVRKFKDFSGMFQHQYRRTCTPQEFVRTI
jgi:hypothetical protein